MRFIHFSDVHFRGSLTRHEEYTEIFNQFFEKCKVLKPDYFVFTGDFVHTKTQNITPELIEKITWVFNRVSEIAPLHILLGNHDGNLANAERQDTLSPIVSAINNSRITLHKKTEVFNLTGKFNLCVFSPFDKEGWPKLSSQILEDEINIALFHGLVPGCTLDNTMRIYSGAEIDMFEMKKFDFAFLGDVHKFQYLDYRIVKDGKNQLVPTLKPWIAYPGSFVQQHFGEEREKGFLVWDIFSKHNWSVDFIPLENKRAFVTFAWQNSVEETVKTLLQQEKTVRDMRLRVTLPEVIPRDEARQLHNVLREEHGAELVAFKYLDSVGTSTQTLSAASGSVLHKSSLRNDPKAIFELYKQYLEEAQQQNIKLTETQLESAKELIGAYLAKLNEQETEASTIRDIVWTPKKLEFSNLFRYGANNYINFDKLHGIVGIFGPNMCGKSSSIAAVMYNLFNTTDRGSVKTAYIINNNKKTCSSKMTINVAGTDYIIERSSTRSENKKHEVDWEKATTSVSLSKVEKDGSAVSFTNENQETKWDTDKAIRKLIGTSTDFLLTAFSSQFDLQRFIVEGATQRKSILNRLLELDIFEKLFKFSNDDFSALNVSLGSYSTVNTESNLIKLGKKIVEKKTQLEEWSGKIQNTTKLLDELKFYFKQHENTKLEKEQIEILEKECESLQTSLESAKTVYSNHANEKTKLEKEMEETKQKLEKDDFENLLRKQESLQKLREELTKQKSIKTQEEGILSRQKKSIEKLNVVPCASQYPSCPFIKDSHEDKGKIQEQQRILDEIVENYKRVEADLDCLQREKIEEQIKTHNTLNRILSENQEKLVGFFEKVISEESAINTLVQQLKEKQQILEEQKTKQNVVENEEYQTNLEKMNGFTKNLRLFETKKNECLVELGSTQTKLEQLQLDKQNYETLKNRIVVYESIQNAFSKNGLPALILKSQLPLVNAELEKILVNVVNFKVLINTEVNSNVLDVFIEDESSRRVIEVASGAEKTIASLALRVALTNLSSLPKPDILILDEPFSACDKNHLQKVLVFINSLKGFFKTILVITHVEELKEIADTIIDIGNINNTESRIRF